MPLLVHGLWRARPRPCCPVISLVSSAALLACREPNPGYRPTTDAGRPILDGRFDSPAANDGGGPIEWPRDAGAETGPAGPARDADTPGDAGMPVDAWGAALIGFWRLDDGRGSATVADSSGTGGEGTLMNLDPATAWGPGRKGGSALVFAPSAAVPYPSVRIPATGRRANVQHFTIAAWIFRTETSKPPQMSVFSQQLGTMTDETFNLCFVGDKLTLYLANIGAGVPHGAVTEPVPFGVWTHVAATWDGQNGRVYRDGRMLGVFPYTRALPASDKPIYLGTNVNTSGEQPFVGFIDDVMLLDTALPDAAIAELAKP